MLQHNSLSLLHLWTGLRPHPAAVNDDNERWQLCSFHVGCIADDGLASIVHWSRPVGDNCVADILAVLKEYLADVREVRRRRTANALVFWVPTRRRQMTPLTWPCCCANLHNAHQYGALVFRDTINVDVKID